MRILSKYVLKEHAGPLGFALTALTSLLLLNYVAKQFGNLVGKGLAWSVIGEFFLLSVPFTVAMTLPMAVLVSTLYAFSRLAAENEITALKASGVSITRILVPVLMGATVIAFIMIGFNDQVLPRANHRLRALQTDIAQKKPTFGLREQVINEVSPGRFFVRAGKLDPGSNRMKDVVIYDLSDPMRRVTIFADSGNMGITADQKDLEMQLYDGMMQELSRTDPGQLQRLFFHVNNIRVRGVGNSFQRDSADGYKSDREMSICEMQEDWARADTEKRRARGDLQRAVMAASRAVVTGDGATRAPETRVPPAAPLSGGIGRLYCGIVHPLLNVPEAAAAIPTASQQQGQPPLRRPLPRADLLRARMEAIDSASADSVAPRPGASAAVASPETAAPARLPTRLPPSSGLQPDDPGIEGSFFPGAIWGAMEMSRARFQESERTANQLAVEIHKKFALAFACVVFVLLGAPIALRFPRGGVGLVIGVSLAVFAVYYMGLIAGEPLGDRGTVAPWLAIWSANIVFSIAGVFLLSRMGKEGSTSRGGDASEMLDAMRAWFAGQLRRVGLRVERRRRTA